MRGVSRWREGLIKIGRLAIFICLATRSATRWAIPRSQIDQRRWRARQNRPHRGEGNEPGEVSKPTKRVVIERVKIVPAGSG